MILVTLTVLFALCGKVKLEENTLELVHVLFRHCDRTPDASELYVGSTYYNESNFHPYGYGQLTNEGKKRCYDVGTALRKRYDSFLNASFHYSLIEARSTYYGRCKESLQLVLAGLFPPTQELTWSENINWLPIAFNYDNKESDKILFGVGDESYKTEEARFLQSEEGQVFSAPFNDLMDYVSSHIGEPVDLKRMGFLGIGIQLLAEMGKPLPEWIQSKYPSPIKESVRHYLRSIFETEKLRRITFSYFFKKIIEDTEMKINGTLTPSNRKMFIYSAHDLNIFILFGLLNMFDIERPPVGTYCLFEVHKINGTYGFKLFYYNNTAPEPHLIQIPGYGDFVPLDKLKIQNQLYLQVDGLFGTSHSYKSAGSTLSVVFLFCLIFNL